MTHLPRNHPFYTHIRLLQVVDELHRIGFEQLRFSRSWFTVHWRLQLYAARDVQEQDGFVALGTPHLCLSDDQWIAHKAPDRTRGGDWEALLAGDMKPKHLAGRFVLSFPKLCGAAYGPDHEYRQWFRKLRPYLEAGMTPSTWEENVYDGDPYFFMRHTLLRGPTSGQVKVFHRPPHNPLSAPVPEPSIIGDLL